MGTSTRFSVCHGIKQDHPHAYGDKSHTIAARPRPYRIIPTRMGTRSTAEHCKNPLKDHPHAYGDKADILRSIFGCPGSSPRVWGQDHINGNRTDNRRIIPTRMGTSVRNRYFVFLRRDHPHAYGDKSLISLLPNTNLGSSPRVWGQERKR